MTPRDHLIHILNQLDLPKDKIVLGGSAVLALRNIRKVRDVDIFARRSLWDRLEASGDWVRWDPSPDDPVRHSDPPYLIMVVDGTEVNIFYDWKHKGYLIDVQWHIDNSDQVAGWPSVNLNHLLQWKEHFRRPKDVEDIKLINDYLTQGGT